MAKSEPNKILAVSIAAPVLCIIASIILMCIGFNLWIALSILVLNVIVTIANVRTYADIKRLGSNKNGE